MPFNRGHTGLELEPSLWNSDDVRAGAAIHSLGDRHLLARTRLIFKAGGFALPAFCFMVIQDPAVSRHPPAWANCHYLWSIAQNRRGPTAVLLPAGSGGLKNQSLALCHQLTTLDRDKLAERIGLLPSLLVRRLEGGLRAALDLEP